MIFKEELCYNIYIVVGICFADCDNTIKRYWLMKINAGKWRGRPIRSVEGLSTRPTPDIVKQAVFNIIRDRTEGIQFCDLFAGTGNMAFEALSRGADHVTLVENGRAAIGIIKQNAEYLGCTADMTLVQNDVFTAVKIISGKQFDVIFMDPPYNLGLEEKTLNAIAQNNLIKKDGIVIVQFEAKNTVKNDIPDCFEIIDERRYGRSALLFLKLISD